MKKILIFMLVAVTLALCLSACNDGETVNNTTSVITTTIKPVSTTKAPENFDHAFTIRGLAYSQYAFSTPSSAAFVGLTTDDTLELFEFGYEGDTVKEVTKTFYLHVEGYDAAQKEDIKGAMEGNFAEAAQLDGVTITHELLDKYYMMRIEMKSLDNTDTLNAIIGEGLLDYFTEELSSLSMAAVEDVMTSHDFIKR